MLVQKAQVVTYPSYITKKMVYIEVTNKVDHVVFKNMFANYITYIHRGRF